MASKRSYNVVLRLCTCWVNNNILAGTWRRNVYTTLFNGYVPVGIIIKSQQVHEGLYWGGGGLVFTIH